MNKPNATILQTSISLLGGLKSNFVDIQFSAYYQHRILCSVIKYFFFHLALLLTLSSLSTYLSVIAYLLILSTPRVQKK